MNSGIESDFILNNLSIIIPKSNSHIPISPSSAFESKSSSNVMIFCHKNLVIFDDYR